MKPEEMWELYTSQIPEGERPASYTAWYFCDNEKDAEELAELVICGIKRATTSLRMLFKEDGSDVPKPGDMSVITDFTGNAKCIIRTIKVYTVPFKDVTAEYAATEGEGDGSLSYWREGHIRFFTRELAELGREMDESVPVVCEEFEKVFPLQEQA